MKKTFVLLMLSLFGTFTTTYAQKISYGLRAGLNVAEWKGDAVGTFTDVIALSNVFETKSKVGFHAGTYVNYAVNDQLSIETALLYSQKGLRVDGQLPDDLDGIFEDLANLLNAQVDLTATSHYIDIPIVARYKLIGGLNVVAGPQISILTANKLNIQGSVLGFNLLDETFDIKNDFNGMDFGFTMGVGYQFENGFNINGNYDLGLSSLDEGGNFDAQNAVFKLAIGYAF